MSSGRLKVPKQYPLSVFQPNWSFLSFLYKISKSVILSFFLKDCGKYLQASLNNKVSLLYLPKVCLKVDSPGPLNS